jgi:hypothetical protein
MPGSQITNWLFGMGAFPEPDILTKNFSFNRDFQGQGLTALPVVLAYKL